MNALIFGRRRQGKSTLARRLALAGHKTVFYFDPNAQFSGLPLQISDIDKLAEHIESDGAKGEAVFRPDPRDVETAFDEFIELLWSYGNYALVLDEASCLQSSHSIHPQLERLMRQAPRDGAKNRSGAVVDVTVIQTIHRPADAHTICRALATDAYIFQTQLARDLHVVEEQWGPEVAAELPRLARWHCVHVWSDLNGTQKFSVWNEPARWYIPITAGAPERRSGNAAPGGGGGTADGAGTGTADGDGDEPGTPGAGTGGTAEPSGAAIGA